MTDKRNMSAKQQLGRRIHQQIVESARDWAWAINTEGIHIYSNAAVEHLLGYSADEIIGKSAFPLMHPEDQEQISTLVQKAIAQKTGWKEIAIRWTHKDGSVRYFESNAQPFFDQDGNLEGFCGIDRDITQRLAVEDALIDLNQKLEQRIEERTHELEKSNKILQASVEEFIKTEEILLETNRRYNALFEGSSDSVYIISLDDRMILANQQAENLLGYKTEELVDMPLSWFMHPDEWADAEEKTASLFSGEIIPPYERNIINKQGNEVQVEVNLTLIRDDDGNPKYFQSIIRDISERKLIEFALRESEEKFRLAFEKGPLAIAIADRNFIILDANETFCQLTSYPKDEIIGNSFAKYSHPDDMDRERALFEQLFKGEISNYTIEKRYVTKSGETVWINLTAGILHDQEGAPQYALGIAEDITKRKQSEAALQESEQRYRELMNVMPDWVAVISDGKVVYANPALIEQFGAATAEGLIGLDISKLVTSEEDLILSRLRHQDVMAGENIPAGEFEVQSLDGKLFTIEAKPTSIIFDGKASVLVVAREISERKKNEEELRQYREHLEQLVQERTLELQNSNEELKAFAYSVSHDLRAPLRAIRGFSDILFEDFSATMDETAKGHLERIRGAAIHMDKLIQGLLEFSRVTYHELHLQAVDLSQMAHEVVQNYQQGDLERQVEIRISPQMSAQGDPMLLRIVLDNLLGNAWKFTRETPQGQIGFTCSEVDGVKVFSVRDNGAGFDMNLADKLFKVFQRLHGTDEFEGTGIGLATVQKIIQRHEGRIWTEAEEGKGAAFFFTLD
jgi:PAS domain S-box-containing protein